MIIFELDLDMELKKCQPLTSTLVDNATLVDSFRGSSEYSMKNIYRRPQNNIATKSYPQLQANFAQYSM